MNELDQIEERLRIIKGNIQMYWLLFIWISLGGCYLAYLEGEKYDFKTQPVIIEQLEIKNPEAATSR